MKPVTVWISRSFPKDYSANCVSLDKPVLERREDPVAGEYWRMEHEILSGGALEHFDFGLKPGECRKFVIREAK